MKKFYLVALILACILNTSRLYSTNKVYSALGTHKLDVSTRVRVGDIWGDKWNRDYRIATKISQEELVVTLYSKDDEAWNYFCRIYVHDFHIPSKKEIKDMYRNKQKWTYPCDIEYFYDVQYPSIEDCFANYGGFIVNSKDAEAKKRTIGGKTTLNTSFFSAGKKIGDDEKQQMHMWIKLDEVIMHIYLRDHLEF